MANPNTAVFPAAVASDNDLMVARDNAFSALSGSILSSDTTIPVTSGAVFTAPCLIALENEVIFVQGPISGNNLTNCTRGFKSTTAAGHASGVVAFGYIFDYNINQLAAEIKSIEGQLGVTLTNVLKASRSCTGDLGGTFGTPTVVTVGGATASAIANAATKAHTQNTDTGTSNLTFQLGTSGPKIKNNSGNFDFRDASDSSFVNVTANQFTGNFVGTVSGSAAPSGPAGGDLTGTYPNPTLATSGATAGTYGNGTNVAQITVDAKGRITSVSNVSVTGAPPSGTAGGDLTGTFPNPTIATVGGKTASAVATSVNATIAATDANTVSTIVKRDASGNFTAGTITATLSGTATSAAPSGSAGGDLTGTYPNPTLKTTVNTTPGTFGGVGKRVQIAANNKGLVTSIVETSDGHVLGGVAGTTITSSTGAGTSPTVSVTGNDSAGQISVLTGSSPATAAVIISIIFGSAYDSAPWVVFSPANAVTAALTTNHPYTTNLATGGFDLKSNAVALAATTTYLWNYIVIG
jgi:hypothetical protein